MTAGELDAHVVVARRDFRLDVAVSAARGETVAIMGPSGAGKSTLLGAIAGLTRLREGFVRIDGTDVAGRRPVPPNRRGIVLLGQEPRLFPHMSARDNVAFGLRAHGADRDHARREADDWLGRVGLDGFGAQRPAELSGGQQQRVALARALATSPRVMLLDEPLTALDPETAGEIRALVAEQLLHAQVTTLVVTHDAVDAASLARRLVIVEDGRVSQEGAVREVLSTPGSRFAAAVAGVNRLVGDADAGRWRSGGVVLESADAASRAAASPRGPIAALVRPGAVRLEGVVDPSWTGPTRLAGATEPVPGTWLARIARLEQTPSGARVHTVEPAVAVDVAADTVAGLGLAAGTVVRLRADPADVRFVPV
ncbi:ABC transporter ATP-binding protein [Microbacterium sp.]|uniref:ABC transporter ATP-binding protein n=1 Tax=Microbacterium sp. TaxID=51671 RepID=UPI0039E63DB6